MTDLFMSFEDAEEWTQSQAQIGAGWWRQRALGVKLGVHLSLGLTIDEWNQRLGGYIKLGIPERKEAVVELTADGMSSREIGAILGVDKKTILNDIKSGGENSPEDDHDEDKTTGQSFIDDHAGENSPEDDHEKKKIEIQQALIKLLDNKGTHISENSGDNEWYTPAQYINAARSVMGDIDIDPASHVDANKIIKAKIFYTKEDDGLKQQWKGRVWMNPPYAQPYIEQFCNKLMEFFVIGDVLEACVLVNNATDTAWFHTLASVASAMCFPRARVKFWHPTKIAAPLQGQVIVYFGNQIDLFRKEFATFGFTVIL